MLGLYTVPSRLLAAMGAHTVAAWRPASLAALVCCAGAAWYPMRTVAATESDVEQVSSIFDAADGPAGQKLTRAEAYERLQNVKPSETDPLSAQYAYLLSLVALNKYQDAVSYADEVIRRSPNDVRFRLLRARLLLREKAFSQVLVDMETAGKSLAAQTKKTALDAETEAACRALGLMVGYIEGPAKPLIKATMSGSMKNRLLADLSPAGQQAFNEQYALVQEEYETLAKKGETALRELQAKHRANAEKLAESRAKLDQHQSEIKSQARTAADELARRWDLAKAEYDALAKSYLDLQSKQAQLAMQRTLLASQAVAAKPKEPRDGKFRDSDERDEYDQQMERYRQLVGQVNATDQLLLQGGADLQRLWGQGAVAQANLLQLQQQGNRLGLQLALTEKTFAKQEAQLNKRRELAEKSARGASLSQYQSFSKYDDFNYPAEKQRLLDSLSQGAVGQTGSFGSDRR